jgi:hypothetical protein
LGVRDEREFKRIGWGDYGERFRCNVLLVPDAFLAIVVSVVSYFFGQHAATNGAYAAGVTAAQAAAAATLAATNNAPPK